MLASKQSSSTVFGAAVIQSPPSKTKYRTFCKGHSELPIHADPCLSQFPQQPITTALECRETIATQGHEYYWRGQFSDIEKRRK